MSYTEIYSSGSLRLARLLKINKASYCILKTALEEVIQTAIGRVVEQDRAMAAKSLAPWPDGNGGLTQFKPGDG